MMRRNEAGQTTVTSRFLAALTPPAVRRYRDLCEQRCDGEGTFDEDVWRAWNELPVLHRMAVCLSGGALLDALHQLPRISRASLDRAELAAIAGDARDALLRVEDMLTGMRDDPSAAGRHGELLAALSELRPRERQR